MKGESRPSVVVEMTPKEAVELAVELLRQAAFTPENLHGATFVVQVTVSLYTGEPNNAGISVSAFHRYTT